MKTNELITFLSEGAGKVQTDYIEGIFKRSMLFSIGITLILVCSLLGVRSDILSALWQPMFWGKFIFFGVLALFFYYVLRVLARPMGRMNKTLWILLGFLGLVWFGFLYPLMRDVGAWLNLFTGTWRVCTINIVGLSIPVALVWIYTLKKCAPVHLGRVGAFLGGISGSLAAFIYGLHCPEMASSFIGFWYVLAIVISSLFGLVYGRYILRW
jgi:hypothetical protein